MKNLNNTIWDQRHGKILSTLLVLLEKENIKNFIIRNYEGLPNKNTSKDVDIIIEPGRIKQSIDILKSVYSENNLEYFYKVKFENGHLCYGMSIHNNMAIHIDLMEGYFSRGSELLSFKELYEQTEIYNGFRILNKLYTGLMVFIYKQFGHKKPKLKQEYRDIIFKTYNDYPEFKKIISNFIGEVLAAKIFIKIETNDFDEMLELSNDLSKALRRYTLKKNPKQTLINTTRFYLEKVNKIIFSYNKHSKVISVMAPDGSGKTTFINALIEKMKFYFVEGVSNSRFSIYHFRPTILPNLGEIGEKAGIKEQNKDFTNPHRAKPANKLSSLIRIAYYWLDYVVGFNILVRRDVQYDRFSVFDRYSYDFLVDPTRTRLNSPLWLRKSFVKCMPHPKVVFYLEASPDVIYKRKQELTLDEITRQNMLYKEVASSNKRFITLDSNRPVNESVDEAMKIILENFTDKL